MSASGELTKKHVAVDLILGGEGATFASSGTNIKSLNGMACDVQIEKAGLPFKNQCRVDIANVAQDVVQKITTLATIEERLNVKKNLITIRAWADGEPPAVCYKGTIFIAYGTYSSPDLGVHIEANTGADWQTTPESPFSQGGVVSAADLVAMWARKMGFTFQNIDVPYKPIRDPVYNGSLVRKMEMVAQDCNFQLLIDDNKVIIQQWGTSIKPAIEVNKHTGMIGYPWLDSLGIRFNHTYNPRFRQGGTVNVKSLVPRATGTWKIIKLRHRLQTEGFGRCWESCVECTRSE